MKSYILTLTFVISSFWAVCQPFGKAIFLDGVNNFIEIPNHSSLHSSTNLTLEAWIKPCKVNGTNVIYSKIWCSGNQNSYFFSVQDGKLKWVWYSGGCGASNGVNRYKSTQAVIQTNVWQHVAIVHSPTNVKLFLDGVEVAATLEAGSYGNLRPSSEPLRVGTYKNLAGSYLLNFSGQLDELRVWNQSISDALMLSRYNGALIGNEPGLMGYYNLDNETLGPNQNIPNNASALGLVGDATSKGSAAYITPFYLDSNTSYILGPDTVLCNTANFSFDASILNGTYSWQNGSSNAGFTTSGQGLFNVSFSNTCITTSDTISISLEGIPVVDLGNDTTICNVANLVLDVTNNGVDYLWSDGSTGPSLTVNQNGLYSVTVSNSCWSVSDTITISDYAVQSTITEYTCGAYTSPSGNYSWSNSGVYYDTLLTPLGCDSVIVINLDVTHTDTSVTLNGGILQAVSNPNYVYQWIDCNNMNSPIPGETNGVYIPTISGSYAVEITHGNCLKTSICTNVTNVGIGEMKLAGVDAFPNPFTDKLHVKNEHHDEVSIRVLDIAGKVIYQNNFGRGQSTIDFSAIQSGIYILVMESKGTHKVIRIVKN